MSRRQRHSSHNNSRGNSRKQDARAAPDAQPSLPDSVEQVEPEPTTTIQHVQHEQPEVQPHGPVEQTAFVLAADTAGSSLPVLIGPGPLVTLNQDRDTSARREITPGAILTYLYDRSRDSKKSNSPGQDFITFRYDDTRLAFAVCDGVSQSFYGDLAARFVGEGLVRWLFDAHDLPTEPEASEAFGQQVDQTLRAWIDPATKLVQARQPAADLPPMIRDALERKRSVGSESMFVAGRLDTARRTLAVCWMGDMRLWLWDAEGQPVELPGAAWLTKERWSTRVGPKNGTPRAAILPLDAHHIARITVHTDGVGSRAPELQTAVADLAVLDQLARDLGAAPASDDVSVLDILLAEYGAALDLDMLAPALPVPAVRVPDPSEPSLRWDVVGTVEGDVWYRIELSDPHDQAARQWSQQWTTDTANTSYIVPAKLPLPVRCRVQALASQRRPSAWSDPVVVDRAPVLARSVATAAAEASQGAVATVAQALHDAEVEPIVTGSRPFPVGVLMALGLLLALALTAGWVLIYLH